MKDEDKTKEQLINELKEVRQRVAELEASESKRKQAEEAYQGSEEDYKRLFELLPIGITMLDMKGVILYCNAAVYKNGSYPEGEFVGKHFSKIASVRVKDTPKFIRVFNSIVRGKIPQLFEATYQRKDGTTGFTELNVGLLKVGGKRRILVMQHDITERKQAEEALKESEQKFRSLFESMLEAFAYCKIMVDENNQPIDYVHLKVNHAWERLVGLKREDVIGKKITEVIPGIKESKTDLISIYGRVALTGESTKLEFHFEPLEKWFNVSVYSPQKEYFVTVFEDITERKQAEEREKELQQELSISSRLAAIGELAAGVAHQINNPLTGILGFSERLLRKSSNKEVKRDLGIIHNEAQRVARVVENLLTFARRREPEKECVDINDVLQKALELMAYELETGNIEVVTDLAPSLPWVMADPDEIEGVFLNIILNAEQAMSEAKGGGRLVIKTQKIKDHVRILFTDDGPGIPAEQLGKIFAPFFTTREEKGGTGLGLSSCHGIVSGHGGRIYARSKPGKGATFSVELPLTCEKINEVK